MIRAVDRFIVYDDVTFIKQGWVNRNRLLSVDKPLLFTAPVKGISPNRKINETQLADNFPKWKRKFLKTLQQSYGKAPYFSGTSELVERVLDSVDGSIAQLALASLREVCGFLGIETEWVNSSSEYQNSHLKAQDRVLDICQREEAGQYINAPGGRELYSKEAFEKKDIRLRFIKPGEIEYEQLGAAFVPYLSMIDVLMFNPEERVREFLDRYELTEPADMEC